MLISATGGRFPRAGREPPRRSAPVGSHLATLFPQESPPFAPINGLEIKIEHEHSL